MSIISFELNIDLPLNEIILKKILKISKKDLNETLNLN